MLYKHGKSNMPTGWVILVVAILLYAFNIAGIKTTVDKLIGGAGGTGGGTGGGTTPPVEIPCFIEDTTIALDSYDKFAKGTEPTGTVNSFHRVWVNGVDQGWKSEGAEITASPGDKVTVWFGGNQTGYDSSGAAYYSEVVEKEVPCAGTMKLEAGLVAYDTSVTFTLKTDDDQVASETNKQAMDGDSRYDMPIRLKVNSKYGYGNPGTAKNILCSTYNTTTISEIKLDGADAAYQPAAIAGAVSNPTSGAMAGGWDADCYYIPTMLNDPEVANDEYWDGVLAITTAGTAPDDGTNDTTRVWLFDTGIDLNADTYEFIYDVQDEDNNDLGQLATQNDSIHLS